MENPYTFPVVCLMLKSYLSLASPISDSGRFLVRSLCSTSVSRHSVNNLFLSCRPWGRELLSCEATKLSILMIICGYSLLLARDWLNKTYLFTLYPHFHATSRRYLQGGFLHRWVFFLVMNDDPKPSPLSTIWPIILFGLSIKYHRQTEAASNFHRF